MRLGHLSCLVVLNKDFNVEMYVLDRQTDRQTNTISKWVESCKLQCTTRRQWIPLTCKTGGGPIWSHESIAGVWLECLRNLRIHYCREPRRYTNSDCRPDIIMFDAKSGSNFDLDISLAHPWSSDVFQALLRQQGLQLIKEQPERCPSTNNTNCLEAQWSKSFHWLWNILDHGEKRENFCRNWQPLHQMKQEDLMLRNF